MSTRHGKPEIVFSLEFELNVNRPEKMCRGVPRKGVSCRNFPIYAFTRARDTRVRRVQCHNTHDTLREAEFALYPKFSLPLVTSPARLLGGSRAAAEIFQGIILRGDSHFFM